MCHTPNFQKVAKSSMMTGLKILKKYTEVSVFGKSDGGKSGGEITISVNVYRGDSELFNFRLFRKKRDTEVTSNWC